MVGMLGATRGFRWFLPWHILLESSYPLVENALIRRWAQLVGQDCLLLVIREGAHGKFRQVENQSQRPLKATCIT